MKNLKYCFFLLIVHSSLLIDNCFSQWVQQTLPVNKPITGIEFTDTLHGWACTSQGADTGYILYTSNGGNNWLVQYGSFNINFTDIDMLNSLTGYVSGADNNISLYKLFKTTDGGVNWTYTTMVPNMYIGDMQFLNKDSAWEAGTSFGPDVRTTTDGGNTWLVRTSGITQPTNRVFFLNYNTGFCGASGILFKTSNTGTSWLQIGIFSGTIYSIFFLNENTGWLGLSPDVSAKVAYTTNGGVNWTMQNLQPYLFNITSIYFFNNGIGFAGVAFNKIYKTVNSGIDWGYQNDTSGANRMSFIDSTKGWSGWNGISHTTNGGGPITYVGIIHNNNQIPNAYKLYQNFPNPFNSQTVIRFSLVKKAYVTLKVYDVLGREKILWQSDNILQSGTHELKLDAEDLSSGVYFYKLVVIDTENNTVFSDTKKFILVK